ncbi:MAG TPA: WD40 repeat domain-containing protein [Terracidiphilus sp.]
MRSTSSRLVFAFAFGASFFAIQPLRAQGTHLWTQSRIDEFEKGTPQGVAIGSNGNLHEGPSLTDILITPSTFIWSVTVDKSGTPFLGTGSPASVVRGSLQKDSKPFTLFESHDVSVQVVRIGPDGSLYAATVPSGKVYKLDPNATSRQDEAAAKVVFDASKAEAAAASGNDGEVKASRESKSHYIWDMTFDSTGRLYIAIGGPGAIYRIDPSNPNAKPEVFFKSDEQHIRTLAWDAKGNLIAGSDGSGLVYRISPQGKAYVLYEASRREITSVAVGADGTIYAASVGDKSHNPLPPIPVQGVGTITFTIVQPGSLQAANASSSTPEGTEVYALAPDQAPRKIWSSKDDIVYALDARSDGVLAISGNRGHIFRIQQNGDYSDIAHVEAQQGLSLANVHSNTGDAVLIGTGNTGRLYSLGNTGKHEYASDVLDAGAYARFGRVEVDPDSQDYEILTRTGNVEQPARGRGDWGWSDWQPIKDGSVQSPAGRFLQWKAVLHDGGKISGVGVNYLPVNAAPEIDDLVVAPGARLNTQASNPGQQQTVNISFPSANQAIVVPVDTGSANTPLQAVKDRTAITVRWAAHDDNGDDLVYSLYLRGDAEKDWHLLKDDISEKAYSFDAALIPDGGYRVKVVASDAPSHNPGESLTDSKESDRFEIDTTPPVMSALKAEQGLAKCAQAPCPAPVHVTFDAEDAASPIAHAEYSLDAGPWQYVDPVGKLSDARREHYDFEIPAKALEGKTGEHLITVRAYDRHENIGVAKTVFNLPAAK